MSQAMSRNKPGATVKEMARRVLETLREVRGVQSAVLFSADGFEIAAYAADAAASARLAAIGSSLAALGAAISAEAGLRDFERATIEGHSGTVMIRRIGAHANSSMSLAIVAGRNVVLGQLMWATQHCCNAIEKVVGE